jgi:hypothetical protein
LGILLNNKHNDEEEKKMMKKKRKLLHQLKVSKKSVPKTKINVHKSVGSKCVGHGF